MDFVCGLFPISDSYKFGVGSGFDLFGFLLVPRFRGPLFHLSCALALRGAAWALRPLQGDALRALAPRTVSLYDMVYNDVRVFESSILLTRGDIQLFEPLRLRGSHRDTEIQ